MDSLEKIIEDMESIIDIHIETTEECIDNCNQPDYVTGLLKQDMDFLQRLKDHYLTRLKELRELTDKQRQDEKI